MKDWVERALKTFVQTFLGILIPESCIKLAGGLPDGFSGLWVALTPVLCSALAAGISAVWNIYLEKCKDSDDEEGKE